MSTTKTKSEKSSKSKKAPPPSAECDVLTLSEAAAYLRVSEEAMLHVIGPGGPLGRLVGGEWRFLKSALQEWLQVVPKPSSREAMLSAAGAMKDDPHLDEILEDIYRQRGRPMVDTDE